MKFGQNHLCLLSDFIVVLKCGRLTGVNYLGTMLMSCYMVVSIVNLACHQIQCMIDQLTNKLTPFVGQNFFGMIHVDAITEQILAHLLPSFLFNFINVILDPCLSKECPIGSSCRVFEVTGEAYCEQSCELENGDCQSHQKCELVNVTCARSPCPPVVNCRGNCNMVNCADFEFECEDN